MNYLPTATMIIAIGKIIVIGAFAFVVIADIKNPIEKSPEFGGTEKFGGFSVAKKQ